MKESGYVRFNTPLAQASTGGLGMCPLLINTDICISQTETVDSTETVACYSNDHITGRGFNPKYLKEKCPTQHCQVARMYFLTA